MALGISFRVSHALGLAVFIAIVVHAFSDGLNTVSMMIKSGKWSRNSAWLLAVDGAARIGGATLGSYLILNDSLLALYLAAFSGFLIYIATSHILPEAHSRHPSRWTFAMTAIGIAIMWLVVAVTS
jgi:ZIP family zinc transporter